MTRTQIIIFVLTVYRLDACCCTTEMKGTREMRRAQRKGNRTWNEYEKTWNRLISVRIPMSDQVIDEANKLEMIRILNKVKATILSNGKLSNVKALHGVNFKVKLNNRVVYMPIYSVHVSGYPCLIYVDTGNRNFSLNDDRRKLVVCRDLVFIAICNDDKQKTVKKHINVTFKTSKIEPFFT